MNPGMIPPTPGVPQAYTQHPFNPAMPMPMALPMPPAPLPAGWTEHIAPTGIPYYYHAHTSTSTYVRPSGPPAGTSSPAAPKPKKPKNHKKKEKPLSKTPIPGTDWLRVRTTRGHVFYTHAGRRESVWEVPEEIRAEVERLEEEEQAAGVEAGRQEAVEGEEEASGRKRKADAAAEGGAGKKARVEIEEEQDEDADSEQDEDFDKEAAAARAQWEAEEAAEQARLAAEETARLERVKADADAAAARRAALAPPNISAEEAKALFKTLLEDLRISPLTPYEDALPLLVPDARYGLLPSAADRMGVFNEYCRERARKAQQERAAAAAAGAEPAKLTPEAEFLKLLHTDVTSTRTSWTEWRRKWKKERRFWGWATEREREARFREWVRELGERKRGEKEGAERRFGEMLRERKDIGPETKWADVKRSFADDPRYAAVGSSAREELFATYAASLSAAAASLSAAAASLSAAAASTSTSSKHDSKLERQQRALRERSSAVAHSLQQVSRAVEQSRSLLGAEEDEREFGSLLVDAVRELDTSWDGALRTLVADARYAHSRLGPARQRHLFDAHLGLLRQKHTLALHTLFLAHAPALNTPFSALPASLITSQPATKLGLSPRALEAAFDAWQEGRRREARTAFEEMLRENAFVSFWGRARKLAEAGKQQENEAGALAPGVLDDTAAYGDEEEFVSEEADGAGGLGKRAAEVGVREVAKVLAGDARWRAWEWMAPERERWVKDWLDGMSVPGRSVHTAET